MTYKLLKANYINKNNVSYSEECIDKMIEEMYELIMHRDEIKNILENKKKEEFYK